MDFARKQLEKYGWTDGKGLGKHENGISQALKPKLKRSVAGIGHDAAADFTEHWWNQLYDKASKNLVVEEKHGKTKKIKAKDGQFKITNSTYHLTKKLEGSSDQEEYSEHFVKTAILTSGGSKVQKVRDSENEDDLVKKDVLKLTDEELFAACEGRTAHKGARHGLKALGKLARIQRQEQILLAESKYSGYSHAKNLKSDKIITSELDLEVVENMNIANEDGCLNKIKKSRKKKRKRCFSNENVMQDQTGSSLVQRSSDGTKLIESTTNKKVKKLKRKKMSDVAESMLETVVEEQSEEDSDLRKQCKKSKGKHKDQKIEDSVVYSDNVADTNKDTLMENVTIVNEDCEQIAKKSKKKKKSNS